MTDDYKLRDVTYTSVIEEALKQYPDRCGTRSLMNYRGRLLTLSDVIKSNAREQLAEKAKLTSEIIAIVTFRKNIKTSQRNFKKCKFNYSLNNN